MMPLPMMSKANAKADAALLANTYVAKPCPAEWARMEGDDRSRFCGSCKKNVYNLSAMTASEAANLIREKEGKLCIRYYQRADGTIITQDCPVGVALMKRKIRRAFAASVVGLASGLLMFTEGMRFASDKPSLFAERFHYWAQRLQPETTIETGATPPITTPAAPVAGGMAMRPVEPPVEVEGKAMILGEIAPPKEANVTMGAPAIPREVRGRVTAPATK